MLYTYIRLTVTHEHEAQYLQNSEVLQSSKVTLGDTCEIIPIQLPAKTDTQTYMNNLALYSLWACSGRMEQSWSMDFSHVVKYTHTLGAHVPSCLLQHMGDVIYAENVFIDVF